MTHPSTTTKSKPLPMSRRTGVARSMRVAKLTLASIALGTLMVLATPALSQFGGFVFDPTMFGEQGTQEATLVSQLTELGKEYQTAQMQLTQLTNQLKDADTQLHKFQNFNLTDLQQMQGVLGDVTTLEKQVPTASGDQFGLDQIAAQLGSSQGDVNYTNINDFASKIATPDSDLQVEQVIGQLDIDLLRQSMAQEALTTALSNQRQADVYDAENQEQSMLDLNSKDPTAGMLY